MNTNYRQSGERLLLIRGSEEHRHALLRLAASAINRGQRYPTKAEFRGRTWRYIDSTDGAHVFQHALHPGSKPRPRSETLRIVWHAAPVALPPVPDVITDQGTRVTGVSPTPVTRTPPVSATPGGAGSERRKELEKTGTDTRFTGIDFDDEEREIEEIEEPVDDRFGSLELD